MRCILRFSIATVFVLLSLPSPLHAQAVARSGEVSGNIGISSLNGVDNNKHVAFGGSGAYNVTGRVAAGFDFEYQRLGSVTGGVNPSESLMIYGPVVRVSLTKPRRVVPYLLGTGGGLSLIVSSNYLGASSSSDQSGAYIGLGGGATVFLGHNWGVRPEFRYERLHFSNSGGYGLVSDGQPNNSMGTISVFYQFGGKQRT